CQVFEEKTLTRTKQANQRSEAELEESKHGPLYIKLLGPQHATKALAHHILRICGEILRNNSGIELFSLTLAQRNDLLKPGESAQVLRIRVRQPQAKDLRSGGLNRERVMSCSFGSLLLRVYGVPCAVNNVVADAVLNVRRSIFGSEEMLKIGLIL